MALTLGRDRRISSRGGANQSAALPRKRERECERECERKFLPTVSDHFAFDAVLPGAQQTLRLGDDTAVGLRRLAQVVEDAVVDCVIV
ncbi:hypothetical protein [Brevibacterium sp. ZH18]|uniref:hypothetical protein n=1 Tax=Brevibacterium sp. ZH18 TaxID=2927784 RepID=UPI001F62284F|nr:hypothetical protein [Brevibacterium sp. ZH18]MCI4010361.1 hypothetical protein [Brevibacterium sp. ZH18]